MQNSIYYTNTVRNVIANLLRCIHYFKSNLMNNMDHVRILGTEPGIIICLNYSSEARSRNQIGDWSYIERSERGCIRNRSGVGRTARGLVSRKGGCRLGRAGFERGCIRDTARIQRGFIGDRYALQSERVIFYPIIPDQAIKIGREWAGVGRASGVNVALEHLASRTPLHSFLPTGMQNIQILKIKYLKYSRCITMFRVSAPRALMTTGR